MGYISYFIVFLSIAGNVSSQRYDPWSLWTKCSTTCGVGSQQRQRRCSDGRCIQRQTKGCVQKICPDSSQENEFTEWKGWSPCSKTCGDGFQERERSCVNGRCVAKERKNCRLRSCTLLSKDWTKWSACSATCGQGFVRRQRGCANGNCNESQTKTCLLKTCPDQNAEEAGFEAWQEWSQCSATCGQGNRERIRNCKSGRCKQRAIETCFIKSCGEQAIVLGDWQSWEKCSMTCGTGIRKRKRTCIVGVCEQTQTSSCRIRSCPGGSGGEYEEWETWQPCSVTCGIGEQRRIRRCVVGLCQQVMKKTCFPPTCPGQTREDRFLPWVQWSTCSKTCGGGERRRSRNCKAPANCVENEAQSCAPEICNPTVDVKYGKWSQWSQCSETCGSGEARRQRTELTTGQRQDQLKQCIVKKCDTDDDKYSNWNNWSGCSVTCGTGISTRARKCHVGKCEDTQTKPCTQEDCKLIDLTEKYGPWLTWGECSATCGFGFSKRERYCRIGECKQTSSKTCRLRPCPTDYTEWEDWGRCSVTCGSGTSTRRRYCTRGTCEEKQQTPCYMPRCADEWEDWTEWQECHKTCGGGFQHRKRVCNKPQPSLLCPGDNRDIRECNTQPCINDTWRPWGDWTACSRKCGTGVSSRKRVCEGTKCVGDEEETVACNTKECVQARWSNWSVWSECTVTCGDGERARTRICINGKQWDEGCFGSNLAREACEEPPCVKARWSKWSPWRPCTATCGEGTTTRERLCIGGKPADPGCGGPFSETNKCELVACRIATNWGEWSSWSICSATCGQAESSRSRTCSGGSRCRGESEEIRDCEAVKCPLSIDSWGSWSEWTKCSVSCGMGTISRNRTCQSGDCVGQGEDVDICQIQDCSKAEWGEWQSWSKCSKTCDHGLTIRTRKCVGGSVGDEGCKDGGREAEVCFIEACDAEEKAAKWSYWSQWSDCPVSCGLGTQSRSRICSVPGSCDGESEEARNCNNGSCPGAKATATPGVAKLNEQLSRTIGSNFPADGDIPWQVVLFTDKENILTESDKAKLGGGSLVNDKWVLTSAHIIDVSIRSRTESVILMLGGATKIVGSLSTPEHAQFYRANKILKHPKFNKITYDFDVALVEVGNRLQVEGKALVSDKLGRHKMVVLNEYVRPVALPCISGCDHKTDTLQNGIHILPYNRNRCLKYARRIKAVSRPDVVVSGYESSAEDGAGNYQDLRLHNMKLLTPANCRKDMRKVRVKHRRARYTGRNICTDKKVTPPRCAGGSGDPLVKQVKGVDGGTCWVQVGVVTFNWACSTSSAQYYADVPDIIAWIAKSIV